MNLNQLPAGKEPLELPASEEHLMLPEGHLENNSEIFKSFYHLLVANQFLPMADTKVSLDPKSKMVIAEQGDKTMQINLEALQKIAPHIAQVCTERGYVKITYRKKGEEVPKHKNIINKIAGLLNKMGIAPQGHKLNLTIPEEA